MKLYGYTAEAREAPEPAPLALEEATLAATPKELRSIAAFLVSCAAEMEKDGSRFEHAHLSDSLLEFRLSPQLVVAKAAP